MAKTSHLLKDKLRANLRSLVEYCPVDESNVSLRLQTENQSNSCLRK
jgi:hypothetical protein